MTENTQWQRPGKVIMPLEETHFIAPMPKHYNRDTLDEKTKMVMKWLGGEEDRLHKLYT